MLSEAKYKNCVCYTGTGELACETPPDISVRLGIDAADLSVWRREKPSRNPKGTLCRACLGTWKDNSIYPSRWQSNIEEYIGGPDGTVERPLKEFQDAIAYVQFHSVEATVQDIISTGSIAIWMAV